MLEVKVESFISFTRQLIILNASLNVNLQATMPSSEKHPSRVPMWKGLKVAYALIAMCLFPLAIGGYWAYGQMVLTPFPFFILVQPFF